MNRQEWNQLARRFESRVCDITSTSGRRLAGLVRKACPTRESVLVDAGCGIGSFTRRFAPQFGRVIAFDFSPRMVARAKKRCAAVAHATWVSLDLAGAADELGPVADLAACLNVITATDAARRRRQWESLVQLTKPGGHVLLVVPSLESARYVSKFEGQTAMRRARRSAEGLVHRGRAAQKHYSRDELRETVSRHGLRVKALGRIHYPWEGEGLDHEAPTRPWDWACLARKPKPRRELLKV